MLHFRSVLPESGGDGIVPGPDSRCGEGPREIENRPEGEYAMRSKLMSIMAVALIAVVGSVSSSLAQEQALTVEAAQRMVNAAEEEARANGWNVTILVVDADGVPVYLRRLTGASPRSVDFAMGKARTSAESGLTTEEYARQAQQEQIQPIQGAITIEGGVPLLVSDRVIGAISVSGVRPDQDGQVARAGAAALGGD